MAEREDKISVLCDDGVRSTAEIEAQYASCFNDCEHFLLRKAPVFRRVYKSTGENSKRFMVLLFEGLGKIPDPRESDVSVNRESLVILEICKLRPCSQLSLTLCEREVMLRAP